MKEYICKIIAVSLLITSSCNNQKLDKQTQEQSKKKQTLSGKVYRIGPGLDSINIQSFGECDCCSGQVAFINDSSFIAIDECLHNNGYFKGYYEVIGDTVRLMTDSLYVLAEVTEGLSKEDDNKVSLKISSNNTMEYYWIKHSLNNKEYFKTNMDSLSYATPDTSDVRSFFSLLKSEHDSIPGILNLKF